MINVLAKLTIDEQQVPMSGIIDESNRKLELHCQMSDLPTGLLTDNTFFYGRPFTASLVDTEANAYTLYNVWFTRTQMAITGSGVMTLYGSFSRLIREQHPNQEYQAVSFTFQGIEKLFPLEQFETHHTETELSFTKTIPEAIEQVLEDGLRCGIQPSINGTVEGDLYDLKLIQVQRIWLKSEQSRSVDNWIEIIRQVKQYIEFVLVQEIGIQDAFFSQSEGGGYPNARMLADDILIPKSYLKEVKANVYRGTIEELLTGLSGWYSKYDEYQRVIEIWLKTIYNLNVSDEDLFIWRAQAFELLCALHHGIHDKAMALMADRQTFPNLKNNLMAAIDELGLHADHETYCIDAKNVRDFLTHNNPDREVTERQKKNSFKLIDYYLRRAMVYVFGIEGLGFFLCLIPPEQE